MQVGVGVFAAGKALMEGMVHASERRGVLFDKKWLGEGRRTSMGKRGRICRGGVWVDVEEEVRAASDRGYPTLRFFSPVGGSICGSTHLFPTGRCSRMTTSSARAEWMH